MIRLSSCQTKVDDAKQSGDSEKVMTVVSVLVGGGGGGGRRPGGYKEIERSTLFNLQYTKKGISGFSMLKGCRN